MSRRRKKQPRIRPRGKSLLLVAVVALLGVGAGVVAVQLSEAAQRRGQRDVAASTADKTMLCGTGIADASFTSRARVAKVTISSPARVREMGAAGRTIESVLRDMEAFAPKKKGAARPNAQVSFRAEALADGSVVASHHSERMLSGASNIKLFTTAAALLKLGPDFRFETLFASDAPVEGRTLKGDLWIVGGGDPSLTAQHGWCQGGAWGALSRVAAQLLQMGIDRVDGTLVLDDRLFTDAPYHPGWPARDRGRAHALDVSALCVEHNRIEVGARATENGVELDVTPPLSGWNIENNISIVGRKSDRGIAARVDGRTIRLSGTISPGESDSTSFFLLDGAELFGATALRAFEDCKLRVAGGYRKVGMLETRPQRVLVRLQSPATLAQIVKVTNRESDNLYAEMLLKALGARFKGAGTSAAGVEVVREVLSKLGVTLSGYAAIDGCGLARDSKVSAAAVVELLQAMSETDVFETYKDSLAVGGSGDGTLRKRFREPLFEGRVHAKTGSLDGATALSGYIDALGGETFVFSCITNYDEFAGSFKPDEDRVVRSLTEIRAAK